MTYLWWCPCIITDLSKATQSLCLPLLSRCIAPPYLVNQSGGIKLPCLRELYSVKTIDTGGSKIPFGWLDACITWSEWLDGENNAFSTITIASLTTKGEQAFRISRSLTLLFRFVGCLLGFMVLMKVPPSFSAMHGIFLFARSIHIDIP